MLTYRKRLGLHRMSNHAQRLSITRSICEAFNAHNAAGIVALLSIDARRSRGSGPVLSGRETIGERLREFFSAFPDASLSRSVMLALPERAVLVEWTLEATGLRAACRGADLLRFNLRGEIELIESRADTLSFHQRIAGAADTGTVRDLAERYTRAWCGGDPSQVAACYQEAGSLTINSGAPSCGRAAIEQAARGFMTAFPGMTVTMDDLLVERDRAVYQWTLEGVNGGPGGTWRSVCISGFEVWRIGNDGLIVESRGYFDTAAYADQLNAR